MISWVHIFSLAYILHFAARGNAAQHQIRILEKNDEFYF